MNHLLAVCAFGILILLPACDMGTPPPAAAPTTNHPATFEPEEARAFLNSVPFESAGDISPVFSENGDQIAFETEGTIRLVDASNGELITEWSPGAIAGITGAEPGETSIEIGAAPFEARLKTETASYRLPLQLGAQATLLIEEDSPRTVRKMFPMNGYDRRENLSPDGTWFASLDGPNLAVRRFGEDAVRVLTDEQVPHRTWFHGNDIWEDSGSIWSPNGRLFIARLHDASEVPSIDYIDHLSTNERVREFRYWSRAGERLPRTELHVVDPESGAVRPLGPAGDHDSHLFFIEWAPDGRSILAMRYARDLSRQEIFSIDVESGEARTLVDRRVEDGWVKWPSGPRTIQHIPGGGYLLRSDEDGFFNYYRLDEDGSIVNQLTDGNVDVGAVIGFGPDGDWLYYLSPVSADRPYDGIPHRVPMAGGAPERLSAMDGQHDAVLSPDGTRLVTVHSDIDRASRADLLTASGELIAILAEGETPQTIAGAPLPERFTVPAADGETPIHGLIFKPAGFDSVQSYPVIHRVYGGMQSRVMREGFWSEGLGWPGSEYQSLLNYLADAGFVVVLMDPPGTPGRGRAYNLTHWSNWPGTMPDDQAAALMALAETRPWMDTARIGIDGNSWGGYVALYSALERPDIYKTASISVAETDLLDHAHWIEWQMGRPADNREAYEAGALHQRMDELQTDLLIIAGTADPNVPVSNTMKLLDGLAEAGKPYDLVLFPGTNHAHQGRGERYSYAVESIRHFHARHLMEPRQEGE